ncbi:MAG TPA: glycosyltransferase family 4 protein [Ktedonobacteraceae bacterium]|nr:glycosyltransferase family 4 protein [Ktedonobacteraceae bacterium]
MKIAQIAPPWLAIPPKNYGGTEQVLYTLVEELVALGHDVTLFATAAAKTSARLVSFLPKTLREEGVPWSDHLKAFYHLQLALQYIAEHDFDIVHTHLSSAADLYIFPMTAGLALPHVATLHSRFPFDRVQNWIGDADDFYLEQWAASVPTVAISEQARDTAPEKLNVIDVVYNGLSTRDFVPTRASRGDFLVWLGRFVPEKGVHLAIEAAKRAQRPIVLAGTVDRYQQASMSYFADVIKPLLDNDQVKYIGPVNQKQKISLLSRAYGFLNPIEWEEPFGMVMIEAMALGCPVISFARGAAPELIVDGQTGFLVDTLDEMVERIPRIADLDRHAARSHVEEHFSARTMAEGYLRVYRALAGVPVRQVGNARQLTR